MNEYKEGALFSSRPPFNDDPEPHRLPDGSRLAAWEAGLLLPEAGGFSDPRPEYDRPQHNPTNPILVEFRKYAAAHGDTARLAAHWTVNEWTWEECVASDSGVPLGTPEQESHAREVLNRLARFEGVS